MRILCLTVLAASWLGCSGPETIPGPENTIDCPGFVAANRGLPDRGEWRTTPAVADVDGDGLDDIAALPRKLKGPLVMLSDGMGGWNDGSEGLEYENGFSCGVGVRLVDLDRDDRTDMVVADHCQGVYAYRRNAEGRWIEASRGIPRNMEGFNDADVGDLNGDGLPDIVAMSAFSRGLMVLYGTERFRWQHALDTGLPSSGNGWQVKIFDVNRDGRPDVLASFTPVETDRRHDPVPPAKVWLQREDGRFRPAEGFEKEGRYFGFAILERGPDEIPDLLFAVAGYHGGIHRYASDDGETWEPVEDISEGWVDHHPNFVGITVADVNADGCMDVLTNEAKSGTVLLAVGDCAGAWQPCPIDTLLKEGFPTPGWGVAAGDFNGDGRVDVVSGFARKGGRLHAWLQADEGDVPPRAQGQGPDASRSTLGSGVVAAAP